MISAECGRSIVLVFWKVPLGLPSSLLRLMFYCTGFRKRTAQMVRRYQFPICVHQVPRLQLQPISHHANFNSGIAGNLLVNRCICTSAVAYMASISIFSEVVGKQQHLLCNMLCQRNQISIPSVSKMPHERTHRHIEVWTAFLIA